MVEILLLITACMNIVGAGINLATAIINSRNRKKPLPLQSEETSHHN